MTNEPTLTAANQKDAATALGMTENEFKSLKAGDGFPSPQAPYELDAIREWIADETALALGMTRSDFDVLTKEPGFPTAYPFDVVAINQWMSETQSVESKDGDDSAAVDTETSDDGSEENLPASSHIDLSLPIQTDADPRYLIVQQRLTSALAQRGFAQLYEGLREQHATTADGKHVDSPGHVVQWLFEQICQQSAVQ